MAELLYHPSTYENEFDFLLTKLGFEIMIDAKYKTKYQDKINHKDIRQVSGYGRLEKVYDILKKPKSESIDCLPIYRDPNASVLNFKTMDLKSEANKIKKYAGVYKIGIPLPIKNN